MSQLLIPIESAIPIRRIKGSNVTLVNQSGIDVFIDTETPTRLNSNLPGANPMFGTKLAANGGQMTFVYWPGTVWCRAPIATTIEVQGQ